jgi:NhaC family Na+:H+ antiporter
VFLVFAFLLSAAVSYTIGSCFATVGTVGVILAVLSKAGGVNIAFTAGAAISGACFGDRTSPVSSCANLIAAITDTGIYENVKNMLKSAAVPMAITFLFFIALSYIFPISSVGKNTVDGIEFFSLTPLLLIPAAAVLLLTMLKINIKMSMFISILISCMLAVAVQKMTVYNVVKTLIFGFQVENGSEFIKAVEGGGVISMLKPAVIVFISSTYSGIFEKTDMLDGFEKKLKNICKKHSAFSVMFFVSLFSSCFTCNQTLTVMTSKQLLSPVYNGKKIENKKLALDISNSAVTLCGLVPWNIACAVPLAAMEADISALPFCVLLYMIPVCSLINSRLMKG